MSKKIRVMQEKDGLRGDVPARAFGAKDKVYNAYLDTLNPRENMEVQLALACSKDIRFKEFLERIQSRTYNRVNLATIAKACCIDLQEFTMWWKREATQRAIAEAQMGSVMITRDMVEDAKSKDVPCSRCDDLGFVAASPGLPSDTPGYKAIGDNQWVRTCPSCKGSKTMRKPGDAHARDRILEMAGTIKKDKAGVSIIQNFGGASHASAVDDMNDKMPMTIDVDSSDVE